MDTYIYTKIENKRNVQIIISTFIISFLKITIVQFVQKV